MSTTGRSDRTGGRFGLPRTVWLLGWISFFADVCSEIVYPIIPLFLKSALGAPASALGLVEGIAAATVSFVKGWSGWHSDRSGKRVPYVRWGYALSAIGKPLIALAPNWGWVAAARTLDRVGKGVRTTARDTLIGDSVERSKRGRAFGLHRGLDSAGALLGVLLALLLLAVLPFQYRLILAAAAIPGVISVVLSFRLREPLVSATSAANEEPRLPLRSFYASLSPGYRRAFWLSILFGLANSSDAFLLLWASDLGLSDIQVVLAYALYNGVYSLLSIPGGVASDRLGRWAVIGFAWALYGAVYLFVAQSGPSSVWIAFAAYGIYMGLSDGVGKALVSDQSPSTGRGTAMGLFHMASGLAALVSSVATGWVWVSVSPEAAFRMCGGIAAVAAALVPITGFASRRGQHGRV